MALASRVPAGAQQLVVHRSLVQPVGEAFSADDLQGLAARLLTGADALGRLGRQGFLYSGMEPPTELVRLLEAALRSGSDRLPRHRRRGRRRCSGLRQATGGRRTRFSG